MTLPARESRHLLEQAMGSCPDFVAMAWPDGRVAFLNEAGRSLVGLPEDVETATLTIPDMLTEENLEDRAQRRASMARDGSWTGMSTLRDWRPGPPIPVAVTAFVVHDTDGTVIGTASIQRDQRDLMSVEHTLGSIESALSRGEQRQQEFLLHMHDLLLVVDVTGDVRYASRSSRRLLGLTEDAPLPNLLDAVVGTDREALARQLERSAAGDKHPVPVSLTLSSDRKRRYEALLGSPGVGGIVVAARDVSNRARAQETLARQAEVLEKIAAEAPLPVVLDLLGRWVEQQLDGTVCAILLVEPSPDGEVLRYGAAPSMPAVYAEQVDRLPVSAEHSPSAIAVRTGALCVVEDMLAEELHAPFHGLARECGVTSCWSFPITSPADGKALGAIALYPPVPGRPDDATRQLVSRAGDLIGIAVHRTRLVARLEALAQRDALTGLPNRLMLLDRLEDALRRHREDGTPGPAVVFLDLDRLTVVNDSLGHERGDELLVHVAGHLRTGLPSSVLVARFGGDEFVVLADGPVTEADAVELACQALDVLSETVHLAGHPVTPSGSAGVVVARPGQSASDVLRDADTAMYRAKHRGGSVHAVFTEDMRRRAFDRLTVEAELRTALVEQQLRLRYQPVWDLTHGDALVGFEALVRWQHPTRGLLLPGEFITLAEETGLIVPLGAWVLAAAADDASRWAATPLSLSVNVSGSQLSDPEFVGQVTKAKERSGPWSLCLELTESTVMADSAGERGVLEELAGLGLAIAVDDFGTGFSSLSRLATLPVGVLKIDSSFVAEVDTGNRGRVVVSGVAALADGLGMATVAEGIERPSQLECLREIGCRYGQGFLLGRPMTAAQAQVLLDTQAHR